MLKREPSYQIGPGEVLTQTQVRQLVEVGIKKGWMRRPGAPPIQGERPKNMVSLLDLIERKEACLRSKVPIESETAAEPESPELLYEPDLTVAECPLPRTESSSH